MQIEYDAKADGLIIIFNDIKANDNIGIAKGVTMHMNGQKLVMLTIRPASQLVDDVSTVISKYISKDEPYPMEIEVTREEE